MEVFMFGFWFAIYGLFFGTLCTLKAKEKNRFTKNWFLFGFIFGIFAYLVLINLSVLESEEDELVPNNVVDA